MIHEARPMEERLKEYEAKLRRELMAFYAPDPATPAIPAEAVFARGHKETIHVPIGNLIGSAPPATQHTITAGD